MGRHDEASKGDSVPSEPPPPYSPSADPVNQSPPWGQPQAGPSTAARPNLAARPSITSPSEQLTPTEVPTPGRPLLRDGKFLVYKAGVFCHKCGNTGYKNDDPYHPCKNCWRKYSRPYTSAIAHSWPTVDQQHNAAATTSQAQNYQRPLLLTHFQPSPAAMYTSPPPVTLNQSSTRPGLLERGGQQNRVPRQNWAANAAPLLSPPPGQYNPPPPPPPGPPPMMSPNLYQNGYQMQQGPLHVLPGDPRIGGLPCHYCRSVGTIPVMFGLDTDICPVCKGVGRVFP